MKEKIKISFLSSIKDRELLYILRSELSVKGFFVAIEESDEEKYKVPTTGAAGPDFIKEIFLPLIKISFIIPLALIAKGFLNEIGSDAYKKIKEILVRVIKNNKEQKGKSRGVVIEVVKKQSKLLDNQLWFFFLDSVENGKTIEALKKIKETIINNTLNFGSHYLRKIWKIGFTFNNMGNTWQILDVQELPPWMLKRRNNNSTKKVQSIPTANKLEKTEDKAFSVVELESQIISCMEQLGELYFQLPDEKTKKNIKKKIKEIYKL